MTPAQRRVLEDWGLLRLTVGKPVVLYHGSTRYFHRFDEQSIRRELVDQFYGGGLFFVPRQKVAVAYAYAARNSAFPRASLLADLRRADPRGAAMIEALVEHGRDIDWDAFADLPVEIQNAANDVSKHIQGSKTARGRSTAEQAFDILTGGGGGGINDYVFERLRVFLGDDADRYRPRVYSALCTASNPLVTDSMDEARDASQRGFDAVVYHGEHAIEGVPEVALFSPSQAQIVSSEIV